MRILKRILLSLIVLTILMVSSTAAYIYYQQDELEQVVIKEINKRLKSTINIGDIEFSVIKNFPFASVELNNILAIDAFQEDTLCEIELLQLKFNALDLYNNIYLIQELTLKNGFISIYYKDSVPNYEIWHSTQDSLREENTDFGLENISLENFKISYATNDIQSVIVNNESQLHLSINNGRTEINLEGNITNEKLILDGINHLPSKKLNINGDMLIDTLGINIKSAIALSDIQLELDFESTDNAMTIKVNTSKFELKPTLKLVPKNYLSALEGYELLGKSAIKFNYISGQHKEAYINVDFDLKEGYIKGKDLPFDMKETSLKGSYSNGKQRSDASTEIKLDDIQFTANGELVQANATIQGLKNPTLITDFNTQMQLSEIEKWGYEHDFKSLVGDAQIKGTYKGKIGLKNKVTYDLAMAEKTVDLSIDKLNLQTNEQSPTLSDANLSMKLIDDNVNISVFNGKIGKESKINFVGAIENVFSNLILKNTDLKIAGNLSSDRMIIDEFLEESNKASGTSQNSKLQEINLPHGIIANINLSLLDLTFGRFHMRNFSSKVSYKNKLLKAKDIVLETMSGNITSTVTFEQVKDEKLRLISTTVLDNINVRQLFYEFHNFGQTTMRHKHLKGKIDSEIYLRNEWDNYFNPIDERLYSFIDVKINNGELLDFEPLMMMSDYISVDELKRIKFSTLENQIEIKNNLIYIPFMEIYSTAIDIAGAGTHSFDNVMDYEFKILLNEILGNKFKRKNKKKVSEFGVVQDDGVKGMTMFLKMQGTVDDPLISYNTLRLRESLSDGFKKEKKELKDVIKNQFNDKNNDNHLQGNPDYDNIIEWEE
ncbi:MAG: AsmA-like C-terminal region-containing protein [Bacteroidota bacterium]|nr:AsmA-like C-terminal region-containing protein [Bacteroidota bacterium]